MNEILKSYSQEEIEKLAVMQLENNDFENNISLKITKIDKEYKKHNKTAVTRAVANGSMILILTGIVLNSESNIANFDSESIMNIFNDLSNKLGVLSNDEVFISIYSKMFDVLNQIIEKIGLIGIILANKSIKFVINTIKDSKKSIKMKDEIAVLEEKLKEFELVR